MSYLIMTALTALAWHLGGWWLLAIVAFGGGVHWRTRRWPALRIGTLVALLSASRLAWLAWVGAPVAAAGELTAAVTTLPVALIWAMALLLPAVVALCAASIGAVAGRTVMFG